MPITANSGTFRTNQRGRIHTRAFAVLSVARLFASGDKRFFQRVNQVSHDCYAKAAPAANKEGRYAVQIGWPTNRPMPGPTMKPMPKRRHHIAQCLRSFALRHNIRHISLRHNNIAAGNAIEYPRGERAAPADCAKPIIKKAMTVPTWLSSSTGKRPRRSDKRPMKGPATNCAAKKAVNSSVITSGDRLNSLCA